MNDYNKEFNELMDLLKTVPGVTEHLASSQVQLGKEILKRRLESGWTQAELVNICNSKGVSLTQLELSNMEIGLRNIDAKTYQNVVDALNDIAAQNNTDEKKRLVLT